MYKYDKYQYYDYYDYEKLYLERSRKHMALVKKWHDFKEKGNVEATKKALKAVHKYQEESNKFKERANEAGFPWY